MRGAREHCRGHPIGCPLSTRNFTVARAGHANMTMSTNQLAERFGAVTMTLEMPFKDNDDLPCAVQAWSPERSAQLGSDCLGALLEWLNSSG